MAANKARLTLSKHLASLDSKQNALVKAVEVLQEFKEESLNDLILQIEAKQAELDQLEKSFKNKEIDGNIETDQRIKEYGYNAAAEIVQENGQIVVIEEEYESIKTENEKLKEQWNEELAKVRKEERSKHEGALHAALSNMKLTHQADTATLTASSEQKEREIEYLNKNLANLTHELDEQRKLTKEVAIAGKSGSISQSFGKA